MADWTGTSGPDIWSAPAQDDSGPDVLRGRGGSDTLRGGGDSDSIYGGADNDSLVRR